ncbi:MAG TPA: contractile injection system protein, VgrG/Pvc8 family [Opitutaceae bacterium]
MSTIPVASLPHLTVSTDGVVLPEALSASLVVVEVTHVMNDPCHCGLTFVDGADNAAVDDSFHLGKALDVRLDTHPRPLFHGVVDSVTCERLPSREIRWTVEATDGLQPLLRNRRMRVFVQRTPGDVATEVARGYGLFVRLDHDGPMHERVVQQGETDLDFLRALLAEDGLFFSVVDGELRVTSLEGVGPRLTLDAVQQVLGLRHARTNRQAPASVRFSGVNFLTHQLHVGEATAPRAPGETLDGEWDWPGAVEDDRQAQSRAEAVLARFRKDTAVLEATVEGELEIHPGRQIKLQGAGAPFNGDYVVTRVRHRIDGEAGYVTEFGTRSPEVVERNRPMVAAYGTVTRLDDPEGQGRVQVALPAYAEVELDWLRVLALGAGKNKGLVMLPDIGEDVLVLFPSGDPAQAVVIGGIFGRKDHPEWGIEKRAVKRFALTSAGGQKIVLSDGAHSIRMENDIGSVIEIGEEKIAIEAKGDLEIAAPGRAIRILAKSVDFEQG